MGCFSSPSNILVPSQQSKMQVKVALAGRNSLIISESSKSEMGKSASSLGQSFIPSPCPEKWNRSRASPRDPSPRSNHRRPCKICSRDTRPFPSFPVGWSVSVRISEAENRFSDWSLGISTEHQRCGDDNKWRKNDRKKRAVRAVLSENSQSMTKSKRFKPWKVEVYSLQAQIVQMKDIYKSRKALEELCGLEKQSEPTLIIFDLQWLMLRDAKLACPWRHSTIHGVLEVWPQHSWPGNTDPPTKHGEPLQSQSRLCLKCECRACWNPSVWPWAENSFKTGQLNNWSSLFNYSQFLSSRLWGGEGKVWASSWVIHSHNKS